jgi:hypothetical protein
MNLKFSKKHLAIFSIVLLVFILFLFFYKPTATQNEGLRIKPIRIPKPPPPRPIRIQPIPPPSTWGTAIAKLFSPAIAAAAAPVIASTDDLYRQLAKGLKGSGKDKVTITVPADPGNPAAGIPGAPAKTITYVFTEDELTQLAKKYGNSNNPDGLMGLFSNHVNWNTDPPSFKLN